MDAQGFASSLAALLRICRTVADQALPIEGMLEFVSTEWQPGTELAPTPEERDALTAVIQAVGDVAAIGARLPAEPEEPQLIQVPGGTSPGPLPSNVG